MPTRLLRTEQESICVLAGFKMNGTHFSASLPPAKTHDLRAPLLVEHNGVIYNAVIQRTLTVRFDAGGSALISGELSQRG